MLATDVGAQNTSLQLLVAVGKLLELLLYLTHGWVMLSK
jgi:hypothetical protein